MSPAPPSLAPALALAVALALALLAPDAAAQGGRAPAAPAPDALAASSSAAGFGLDLYRALARDGNLFVSPLSVSGVLSMAYAGAAGGTAEAFEAAMRLPYRGEELLRAWKGLEDSLAASAGEGSELSVAGSLWPAREAGLKRSFLRSAERAFGARIFPQDFAGGGDAPRQAINEWAERETKGRVKDLVPWALPPGTRLVLANAVYFRGGWLDPFDPAMTREGAFRGAGGKATARFMRRTGPSPYLEDGLGQALELPYAGRRLSMVVLLPKDSRTGMADLEASLSGGALAARLEGLAPQRVEASLPRFSFGWGTESLRTSLEALGLLPVFGPEADFSGMTGDRSLRISDVLHRAFVDVTEEGTEAAAASAAVILRSAPQAEPAKVFKADRPFVFLIRDRTTGALLFIGRLADPAVGL